MNESYNKTSVDMNDDISGIEPSNNFLGLLPLPYSMSTLKSSLPSLSSSYVNSYTPPSSTNNNNNNSTSLGDLNNARNQSNIMSSSSYRRTSYGISKPTLFNQAREKERFELSTLNDKFADYVEKVRYLEAQNKKVQMDTNFLTEKQQENCQKIKSAFEKEIAQLKEVAEKLFKEKNSLFTNSQDAQNTILPLKQRLELTFKESDPLKYDTEKVEQQLSSIEGDIMMYKRRFTHQDNEQTQWKQLMNFIQRILMQVKNEIHSEILTRTTCEQTTKQLRIDATRLREHQQQKLKDLKQSSFILSSNSTNDRAHMFKSELSNAIRGIRQDFERQNDLHRNELYTQFTRSYDDIARQYSELGHLFSNEREQERIKQEEERIRLDIQRVRTDSNLLKQKNSELKLRIRELEINLEMSAEENKRIDKLQQNEIEQFKLKHEKITKNYEDVLTKQTTLENEIDTYRNLLEGTMKPVVDNITDGYNSMTNSQTKLEQQNDYSNRKSRSSSVDRLLATSFLSNTNNNSYNSCSTLNYNDKYNRLEDSLTPDIDILTSNNEFNHDRTKSVEDITFTSNDNDQHIVETNETISIRHPIVIPIRRNN